MKAFFCLDDGRRLQMCPCSRKEYEKFVGHHVTDSGWLHWKSARNYHEFTDLTRRMIDTMHIVVEATENEFMEGMQ